MSNPVVSSKPYVTGLLPMPSQSRFGSSRFGNSKFIETIPSTLPPPLSEPSVTPLGEFTDSALTGSGTAATFYTTSNVVLGLLETVARELGVTMPQDSLEDVLHQFGKYEIRKNQAEWEVLIGAFEKQHQMDLPKLTDESNTLCNSGNFESTFRESVYKRRSAFLDAVQKVSLHQPQHVPSHSGNKNSHLNPANFGRLA